MGMSSLGITVGHGIGGKDECRSNYPDSMRRASPFIVECATTALDKWHCSSRAKAAHVQR